MVSRWCSPGYPDREIQPGAQPARAQQGSGTCNWVPTRPPPAPSGQLRGTGRPSAPGPHRSATRESCGLVSSRRTLPVSAARRVREPPGDAGVARAPSQDEGVTGSLRAMSGSTTGSEPARSASSGPTVSSSGSSHCPRRSRMPVNRSSTWSRWRPTPTRPSAGSWTTAGTSTSREAQAPVEAQGHERRHQGDEVPAEDRRARLHHQDEARGALPRRGQKVKLTIMFRGREMAHPELGEDPRPGGRGRRRSRSGGVGAAPGRPQHDDGPAPQPQGNEEALQGRCQARRPHLRPAEAAAPAPATPAAPAADDTGAA